MVPVIITTWYNEKNEQRRAEYIEAIKNNLLLGWPLFILCEDHDRPPVDAKYIGLGRRPTFQDAVDAIMPEELGIIINTDCYIDETFKPSQRLLDGKDAWCLSRHDHGVLHHSPKWSQDCWAFIKGRPLTGLLFHFGKMACDNAMAEVLTKAGYVRKNPCYDVRVNHVHKSGIRNYNRDDLADYVVDRESAYHTPACYIDSPLVSFITPHGNRLEHLKQTVPHNLAICKDLDCEFVVCHSGDKSDAGQWLMLNHPQVRNCFINGERFHYARACNHAHRHARGIIQCTLDADQLLTEQYIEDLLNAFRDGRDAIYHEHNALSQGANDCAGRISVLRATFARIGGYEERFRAWGGVDTEFVNRCCDRIGLINRRRMVVSDCIKHSDDIRQKGHVEWSKARALFTHMRKSGYKIANQGVPWGMEDDACLPTHGEWGFNAGILPLSDGYLTAERYLTDIDQWAVMLRRFDQQWREIERVMPEHWIGFEDVRLIHDTDGRVLAYGTWAKVKGRGHAWSRHDVHMVMAHVVLGKSLVAGNPIHLKADFPQQGMEKNWMLFHNNGELLASYGLRSHLILSVDRQTGLCKRRYVSQIEKWQWPWGEPRGGSNWLDMGDHMLSCCHSMLDQIGMSSIDPVFVSEVGKDKYYSAFFVLAEKKPPFKIIAVSKERLGPELGFRDISTKRSALVKFPMSIYRYGNDICVAYGENDERTRVVKLAWDEIKGTLMPVPTAKAPFGEMRCA